MQTVDTRALLADALPEKAQLLAIPLSSAVEGFVRDRVDRFFASDRFEKIWATATTRAHEQAVRLLRGEHSAITAKEDGVEINLVPMINAVLAQILDAAPSLVGSDVKLPTITVDDVPEVGASASERRSGSTSRRTSASSRSTARGTSTAPRRVCGSSISSSS